MCMDQYQRLFSCYRYPGLGEDRQEVYPPTGDDDHATVVCRGRYFSLQLRAGNEWLSEEDCFSQLRRIRRKAVEAEEANGDDYPRVGYFTTNQRDLWAKHRQHLLENVTNQESLKRIETSLFLVCLDKPVPKVADRNDYTDDQRLRLMVHGGEIDENAYNRWYDKTMQFIVGEDGACGLNYEHSCAEAIVVFHLLDYFSKYMKAVKQLKLKRMSSICDLPEPQCLKFELDAESRQHLEEAKQNLVKLIKDTDCHVVRFNEFGRNFPKSCGMSPDAFMQVCLQLTYYRLYGKVVSTYESASIRRFKGGRVDNIRGCSVAALNMAKAFVDKDSKATDQQKLNLIWTAVEDQTEYMLRTILGKGIDNHLMGLKASCAEIGIDPLPDFFTDPLYLRAHHFTQSTSQVTTPDDGFIGYGAVVPDGYGVAYNLHPDSILICIGSFFSCGETSTKKYEEALKQSLREMHDLVSTTKLVSPRDRLYS